jgi:hypothetical protein
MSSQTLTCAVKGGTKPCRVSPEGLISWYVLLYRLSLLGFFIGRAHFMDRPCIDRSSNQHVSNLSSSPLSCFARRLTWYTILHAP